MAVEILIKSKMEEKYVSEISQKLIYISPSYFILYVEWKFEILCFPWNLHPRQEISKEAWYYLKRMRGEHLGDNLDLKSDIKCCIDKWRFIFLVSY